MDRFWVVVISMIVLDIVLFAIAWEQPDCAGSMRCRGTVTIPQALDRVADSWIASGKN